jgi:hypothetical protein
MLGCSSGGVDIIGSCLGQSPPDRVDAGGVDGGVTAGPEPVGDSGGQQAPSTFADVARECSTGGGRDCDESRFISAAAAMCIARVGGLAPGLQPWSVWLMYAANYRRVVWMVMTVREASASGYRGELLVLDAVSGDELERTTYATDA